MKLKSVTQCNLTTSHGRAVNTDIAHPMLSVIVPAYNELATLEEVVRRLENLKLNMEILIVGDGSSDGPAEIVRRFAASESVKATSHPTNRRKGAAVRTAIAEALGDVIVIQDADLEYDPNDIVDLIRPIVEGRADVVFGSRFSREIKAICTPTCRWANRFLTWLSNRFTGLTLTDMETWYRRFIATPSMESPYARIDLASSRS